MRADPHTFAIRPSQARTLDAPRRSFMDGITRRSLFALFGKITRGSISLVDGDERFLFGQKGDALSTTITVVDPRAYRAILFGGSVGAGDAYVKRLWTCDDLPALARILARNLDVLDAMDSGVAGLAHRIGELFAAQSRRNTRAGSRRNIAHHYDLSNELFDVFLDPSMMYSSAIFASDEASLAEAQITKLDRVCQKLVDSHGGYHGSCG